MSMLLVMRLGTMFFGGRALQFQAELYGGLLLFVGYILVDTQACPRQLAAAGPSDPACTASHVMDACRLLPASLPVLAGPCMLPGLHLSTCRKSQCQAYGRQ